MERRGPFFENLKQALHGTSTLAFPMLDDIVIFAKNPKNWLRSQVLDRFRAVGLKVKLSKCVLFQEQIPFLGHQISQSGVEPLPEKIKIIKNWPRTHCFRYVTAFYGLASYYRRIVNGFATNTEPLTKLTSKNVRFQWNDEVHFFENLKQALHGTSTLAFPNQKFRAFWTQTCPMSP